MQSVKAEAINKIDNNYPCILWTPSGVVVDQETGSPILVFLKIKDIVIEQKAIMYIDNERLLAFCDRDIESQKLAALHFTIMAARDCLASNLATNIKHFVIRTFHWFTWDNQVKFCNHCGNPVQQYLDTHEKRCEKCNGSFFPKLSPAVLVLVQKGNEILLGRSHYFQPGVYSALAGYIDVGETAEQAAVREVFEESGIKIVNLFYFGSQSWPLRDSFLVAFLADYASGELTIDKKELEDAAWFKRDNLPPLPPAGSISRRLIDSVL